MCLWVCECQAFIDTFLVHVFGCVVHWGVHVIVCVCLCACVAGCVICVCMFVHRVGGCMLCAAGMCTFMGASALSVHSTCLSACSTCGVFVLVVV